MKTTQKSMKSVIIKIWADNENNLMKSVKILPHNEKNNEKKIILQYFTAVTDFRDTIVSKKEIA